MIGLNFARTLVALVVAFCVLATPALANEMPLCPGNPEAVVISEPGYWVCPVTAGPAGETYTVPIGNNEGDEYAFVSAPGTTVNVELTSTENAAECFAEVYHCSQVYATIQTAAGVRIDQFSSVPEINAAGAFPVDVPEAYTYVANGATAGLTIVSVGGDSLRIVSYVLTIRASPSVAGPRIIPQCEPPKVRPGRIVSLRAAKARLRAAHCGVLRVRYEHSRRFGRRALLGYFAYLRRGVGRSENSYPPGTPIEIVYNR
jgi:hypothetical protein